MLKRSLNLALALAIVATAHAQTSPKVEQNSDKSTCSNIVALAGNVSVNCSNLTPEQQKLFGKIPTLLNRILANQANPKVLSDKLDEVLETLSRLNQPPTVNYAPGGFATSGGTLVNPQVNNFRDPLPAIDVTQSMPIPAQPKPETPPQIVRGLPFDPRIYNPGASVTITVKGAFRNPAFVADCDVPCSFDSQFILQKGASISRSTDFQSLSRADNMGAGVAYNLQMYAGFKIQLTFRSLDDRPLTVSNVRAFDPYQ